MKRKSKFLVLLIALTSIFGVSNAQEKYAVLITGDYAISDIPLEEQWNQGQGKDENGYFPEFWYDTYLMWEMLVKDPEQGGFGYTDENVFVLFANGEDFYFENMSARYNADISYPNYYPITDYPATYSNVEAVFTGLATGTGDFPQVTEDDFLFVWTFDHGGPLELVPGPVYIQLMDEIMWDYEFAELTDQIPAHKKVFWMQQCRSGGFEDDLEAPNTVLHSSCQPLESSFVADNKDINGNDVVEWEEDELGQEYRHGEFNFHTYSATVGESPDHVNNYNGQPYTEADENNDNYISILESYYWEESHESIDYGGQYPGEVPLYSDIGDIGDYTSLEYPTLLCTDITQDETHRGLIGISKNVHVTSGKQLKFITNAKIFLLNDADLVVDAGATLIIEDGVTITGTNGGNKIEVDGLLEVGQNVTFTSTGPQWDLYLNNYSLQAIFENTTFNKCEIHNYGESLTISNSTFDDCFMAYSHRGIVNISSTDFDHTWLYLENNEVNDKSAIVSDCNFTTDNNMVAIDLWDYNLYDISNNTIDGYAHGIQIMQSGYGQAKQQMISDNTITNCIQCGILMYGTLGTVYRNHITNNMYGVWLVDNSSIRLCGYSGAQSLSETQTIEDNDSFEVYASQNSFPFYFRFNGIIDEDNLGAPHDPLVYHSHSGGSLIKDVRYNCWGENFDPEEDFYPGEYLWDPIWCPGDGDNSAPDPDEDMYEIAYNLFDAGDYIGAKSMYEMLIDQYPQSEYAKAAMHDLFALEKFVSDDYNSLKQYYANDSTIQSEPELAEMGGYLVSKCDVKLENWPDPIDYFENIILDPETLEDSIFAIIDLGYVYFVMENSGYKSAYTGNLIQYKPASKEQFIEYRNYLLSLIPGDKMSKTMKGKIAELKAGELLQNVPNPFRESTQIWYKLENESNIQLNIFNYTGQLILSIDEGTKTKGTHFFKFDASGLKSGIYFYSININGKTTDSKKMMIMK
ncbi:MAG: T9SS type A sorting domain-containing protein [Bacteroidales bacterium]|nr:T9SS type A sorting domain-containing protein [Bacteroidales bacterium]